MWRFWEITAGLWFSARCFGAFWTVLVERKVGHTQVTNAVKTTLRTSGDITRAQCFQNKLKATSELNLSVSICIKHNALSHTLSAYNGNTLLNKILIFSKVLKYAVQSTFKVRVCIGRWGVSGVLIWLQTHFSKTHLIVLVNAILSVCEKLHTLWTHLHTNAYTQNTQHTFTSSLGLDPGHLKVISLLSEGFPPYSAAPRIQTWQAPLRFLFWFLRKSVRFHLGRLNPSWGTIACPAAFILVQQIK